MPRRGRRVFPLRRVGRSVRGEGIFRIGVGGVLLVAGGRVPTDVAGFWLRGTSVMFAGGRGR